MINKSYSTINILKKSLDASWMRNEAITNNIANVNTPGYKRITVEFEEQLENLLNSKKIALTSTNEKHLRNNTSVENIKPSISEKSWYSTKNDENNVNIDVEMADMAKNSIMYNSLISQISREFNRIKTVINEGGR